MTDHVATPCRIGVDVGGTFTDVALEVGGIQHTAKTLTTTAAPERGVLTAIHDVLAAAGVPPSAVDLIIYGTTLATNLLIERKGATTALVTTDGFRDVVEMRNENRFDQYDVDIQLPPPLVPRALRLPVAERVDARGRVLLPLDEDAVTALVPQLQAAEVQSVAIGFLHSYANDVHERRARDILHQQLPDLAINLSAEVSPELREWERFSTACANAYVRPLMDKHLHGLEHELHAAGLTCPLLLMLSGGGVTTVETARRFPVRMVESGPAGGAMFAAHIARQLGLERVVSYDMGGTTAKLCMIDQGAAQTSRSLEVARVHRFMKGSGLPLRIPVIEMVEIGAGGGSIARVDALQRITVGPQSAGSDPGPACYGLGGTEPTVTDADVVLGRIDPAQFAGGRMHIDAAAAETALAEAVGRPLGLDPAHAALGVAEMVDENMAGAARVHAIESGKVIEARTLIAFGGAAPLHAVRVAQRLGIERVIVPPGAGVGSAVGFLRAPVSYEVTRSYHQRLGTLQVEHVNRLLDEMSAEARLVVEPAAGAQPLTETCTAFMRYIGQGHEVGVEIPVIIAAQRLGGDADQSLRERFEAAYDQLYDRIIPGLEIEVLTWVVALSTPAAPGVEAPPPAPAREPEAAGLRAIVDPASGVQLEVPYYLRTELPAGAQLAGPAVVVEDDTATLISAGFSAQLDTLGYLAIQRGPAASTTAATERAPAATTEHETTVPATATATTANSSAVGQIHLQVMWNRLLSVVEEQAQTLVRTAFSTSVREAGDLAAAVFDRRGRMLAQAVTGTPGHINAMAEGIVHFIARYPVDQMRPGDVFITNDPWMTSGHLLDVTVVTPAFRGGRVVALLANTCHVVDIGGRGFGPDGRQVYEEGLYIPIVPLFERGQANETLLELIRANVREPRQVIGDIFAFAASNDTGCRRLLDMMDEFALEDIDAVAELIIDRSRQATIERIAQLRRGTFNNSLTMDGYDRPVTLQAALTVTDDHIHVDYAGTSPPSAYGINVVLNYTKAYTCYGVKCVVAPDVPNNYGALEPITFSAPEDSILNAPRPFAVAARHIIGHLLPDTVMGCLQQVVTGGVQAEGASSLWNVQLRGGPSVSGDAGFDGPIPQFEMLQFNSGGGGARPTLDGLNATAFPSGVRGMPVETNEAITPVIFWRKEFRRDSGGAGRSRGGLGQVIEIGGADGIPFDVLAMFERCDNAPRGRQGGKDGAAGRVSLASGTVLRPKGQQSIPPHDRLRLELPGGAGYGDPLRRPPELVAEDVRNGLVSPAAAASDYGVVVTATGAVDGERTADLRGT